MDSGGPWIPNIIDEIPILAVLGTRTQNGIRFRDAAELRAKESDRIHAVARNLRALGAAVEAAGSAGTGAAVARDAQAEHARLHRRARRPRPPDRGQSARRPGGRGRRARL